MWQSIYNHFEISGTWRKTLLQKSEYKLFRWDLLVKCSKVSILSIKKTFTIMKRNEKKESQKTLFSNCKNFELSEWAGPTYSQDSFAIIKVKRWKSNKTKFWSIEMFKNDICQHRSVSNQFMNIKIFVFFEVGTNIHGVSAHKTHCSPPAFPHSFFYSCIWKV